MLLSASTFLIVFATALIRAQTSDGFNTDVYAKDTFYSPVPIIETVNSYSILFEFSNVIVDKTLLIKRVLECDKKVMVTALPRGFGKTTTMEMLKAFFEIQVDEWGREILPKSTTTNHKLFTEGIYVSDNEIERHNYRTAMLIARHTELFDQYQGQRPVIHLKFGHAIDISYDEFYLELRKAIKDAFMAHDYLLDHYKDIWFFRNGTGDQIRAAKRKIDLFNDRICLDKDESSVIDSVYALSEILAEFFDRPIVIMIDEYDHFVLQVFKWALDSPEGWTYRSVRTEQRVLAFYRKWFERILHDNVFCERAFLNGRTLICQDEIFASVEDYVALDMFTNPFDEFYGFTEREVRKLFKLTQIPDESWRNVEQWYRGYNLNIFGDTVVYNQLDIGGLLASNGRISNYWENEYALLYGRDIRRLFLFKPMREFYTNLIQGATVQVPLTDLKINQSDKIRLAELLAEKRSTFAMGDPSSYLVIKELSIAGYLTNAGLSQRNDVNIRFANMECASVCARILNCSIEGNYAWLNDSTLFRFAPEYYDEMERIRQAIRTRRPNVIFQTPSKAAKWKPKSTLMRPK